MRQLNEKPDCETLELSFASKMKCSANESHTKSHTYLAQIFETTTMCIDEKKSIPLQPNFIILLYRSCALYYPINASQTD